MKGWKQFLCLLALGGVLVAAFLLPGKLLEFRENQAAQRVYTAEAAGTLSAYGIITLPEKLAVAGAETAELFPVAQEIAHDAEVLKAYDNECGQLYDLNAIPWGVYKIMAQSWYSAEVWDDVLLDTESGGSLRVWSIQIVTGSEATMDVTMDRETEKILFFSIRYDCKSLPLRELILYELMENADGNGMLSGWAAYYELILSESENYGTEVFSYDDTVQSAPLFLLTMSDVDGGSVDFRLTWEQMSDTETVLRWSAVPLTTDTSTVGG